MKKIVIFLFAFIFLSACAVPVEANAPADTATPPTPAALSTQAQVPTESLTPTFSPSQTSSLTPTPTVITGNRVTHLGVSGFMVVMGDKKVLFDAFNDAIPYSTAHLLTSAQPPFDHVDLILTTHSHNDHFNASQVKEYLKNSPETRFVSTTQAVKLLETELGGPDRRLTAMDPKAGSPVSQEIDGIQVEAIYMSHGIPPDGNEIYNNAYLVTFNGLTIFHSGDTIEFPKLEPYHLEEKKIDIGFIVYFYLTEYPQARSTIEKYIRPKYLLPIHYPQPTYDANKVMEKFPEAILFKDSLDSWRIP